MQNLLANAATRKPLNWRAIRKFPAMPTRHPSRCSEIGRHFPELVSRDSAASSRSEEHVEAEGTSPESVGLLDM